MDVSDQDVTDVLLARKGRRVPDREFREKVSDTVLANSSILAFSKKPVQEQDEDYKNAPVPLFSPM